MYLPNAARTDSRKSSNVLKYFRKLLDYMRISGVTSPKSTDHRLMKRHGWVKMKSGNGSLVWKMACRK
jgi:hypothetical protein